MTTTPKNPEKIRQMFADVAKNYDKANNILSVGVHHVWRNFVVKKSGAKIGDKILDCATGTGDLAIAFKKVVGPSGQVTGLDFCKEMLDLAPPKAKEQNLDITFVQGDVMDLKFADNTFDVVSISFGIRNVSDPLQGLKEMSRVLKPGGKLIVLEFGKMKFPVIGALYNFYSEKLLPKIGGLITGKTDAYDYLQKSSAQFPSREDFCEMMMQTQNLKSAEYQTLTGGIAYLYTGLKK